MNARNWPWRGVNVAMTFLLPCGPRYGVAASRRQTSTTWYGPGSYPSSALENRLASRFGTLSLPGLPRASRGSEPSRGRTWGVVNPLTRVGVEQDGPAPFSRRGHVY